MTFDDLRLGLDLVTTEFSTDYTLPSPKIGDLKFGYDLEEDVDDFDNRGDSIAPVTGVATVSSAVTNHFRYRQTVNAVYASMDRRVGPWTFQLGVRGEAARARWRLVTGQIPGGRADAALYPTLHLERTLSDEDRLIAGVGRRVTRPDPEALNPFSDHQDVYNLRAGNPYLRPEDTWSGELSFAHTRRARSYGATAYYRFDRNSVTDVADALGGGVVLLTKANLPKSTSAGLEFNAGNTILRTLGYHVSGNAFYTQIDATRLGATGLKSTTGLNVKASLDYRPTATDTLQLSASRTDRRLTPQGSISAINLFNLGYRRQLRPDLAFVVTLSDAFDGQTLRRSLTTADLRDLYKRHQVGRVGLIGLVYTFGGKQKTKASEFDYAP